MNLTQIDRIIEIVYLCFIAAIFLKIAYVDFKEQYIYDFDLLVVTTPILMFNVCYSTWKSALLGGVIGFLIGYVIFAVSYYVYKEEAFGFGDVLLLGVIGLFFGFPTFLDYFAITIMVAGIFALVLILYDINNRKMTLPLAPVFIVGMGGYVLLGYPSVVDVVFYLQDVYHIVIEKLL